MNSPVKPAPDSADIRGAQRMLEQIGGIHGLIYSTLPIVVFVPVSSLWALAPAITAALATAAAVLVWRIARRESLQPAFSGFFGVGVCVLIAHLTGESRGYFLLGIWVSLAWAVVFGTSVLVRRPLVGYLWNWFSGRSYRWRDARRAQYAIDGATLTWMLVFASRFAVQRVLYNADETGWLGVARIAMGWPLAAGAALVTYLAVRYAERVLEAG